MIKEFPFLLLFLMNLPYLGLLPLILYEAYTCDFITTRGFITRVKGLSDDTNGTFDGLGIRC